MTEITWPSYTDDDGTFTSGTIIDETFLDAIETEINTLVHSATNPTVTPADIIDEVVTARGSKASVDARLDVEHNNDGTHNLPATVATTAVLASSMHGRNLCADPLMYCWSQGDAAAPDHYTFSGTAAVLVRTGTGLGDTIHNYGDYAANVTWGNTTDAIIQQSIWQTGDHASLDGFEGEKLAFSVWVYSATASKVKAFVQDGNTEGESDYHTGGSSWERLEVVHTISASATKLEVGVKIEGAGDFYASAFCAVFSDTAPDRFIPGAAQIGTIVWPLAGTLTNGDGQAFAIMARPGIIRDVQVYAKTAGGSGGIDFDIEIGDGTTFASIFAGAKTVDAADEFANFAVAPTAYSDRCIAALHHDNGDNGDAAADNAVLRLNIDDHDSAADVTFFVRVLQWIRPLEDALAYNSLG